MSRKSIKTGDKRIATSLEIEDRVNTAAKNQAFVTLKDHKDNFNNSPTCRLINPSKSEIGKISKQKLEKINAKIKEVTKYNQWKNTNDVITWFKNIENKSNSSFICFDVESFYPSITQDLLEKALVFASNYTEISMTISISLPMPKNPYSFTMTHPGVKRKIVTLM